ncbi:MAG: hypothetical protein ACOX52_22485 [Verrucomicrobiota bacterium]
MREGQAPYSTGFDSDFDFDFVAPGNFDFRRWLDGLATIAWR